MIKINDISIKTKVILLAMTVSMFVMTLMGISIITKDVSQIRTDVTDSIEITLNEYSDSLLSAVIANEDLTPILTKYLVNEYIAGVVVNGADKSELGSVGNIGHADKDISGYFFSYSLDRYFDILSLDVITSAIFEKDPFQFHGFMNIHTDTSGVVKHYETDILILAMIFTVSIIFTFLLAGKMHTYVSGPIVALSSKANYVTESKDYSVRAEVTGTDEVGKLTSSFNSMLSVIQKTNDDLEKANYRSEYSVKRMKEKLLLLG